MTLPTGTVTFLFTDIEGSTRLLQALGDAYPDVLARHNQLVREAVAAHEGLEVGTEGDAFFCVFTSAGAGVEAAVEAQRSLMEERWPSGTEVRVRMGLHTGEGRLGGDDYVGIDVNRAARVADAGHGGQILLSNATAGLVEHHLPTGISLRDLGSHRLKDLPEPEHLFDLVVEGLPSDFPPPRTLDLVPNNLPASLTSFHGRTEELARAKQLLQSTRLLTLTGPGGTGKTRLAQQLAADLVESFPDGVWFVDLSPISDPELVPSAIATSLGLRQAGPPLPAVAAHLAGQRVLLVLDNFEQVLAAAPVVTELLLASPDLKVVATSRAPLRVTGEQELPVPPLELPPAGNGFDTETLARVPSVALFLERAGAVRPDFHLTPHNAAAVAKLATRLDGLPLALELAAARVRLLSPAAILERLGGRPLALLSDGSRDRPSRQQTLRDAIEWSHQLLDEPARRLFRRLAVFSGGAFLEEVEAVAGDGDDILGAVSELVDQSLLRQDTVDEAPRMRMLETIRELALEQLAQSGEEDRYRRRHAEVYLELAERAAPHLTGWDRGRWLDRLEVDHDNLRAALSWATHQGWTEVAMRLPAALWRFWHMRGHLHEAQERVDVVLRIEGAAPALMAGALEAAGGLAHWRGDWQTAFTHYDRALRLARESGDRRAIANALYNRVFGHLDISRQGGRSEAARADALESLELWRDLGDAKGEARSLWALGNIETTTGDDEKALDLFRQAEAIFRRLDDPFDLGWAVFEAGGMLRRLGRLVEARRSLEEGLEIFHKVGDISGINLHLAAFTRLIYDEGDVERAVRVAGAVAGLQERSGTDLATVVLNQFGDIEEAFEQLGSDRTAELLEEGREMSVEEAVAYVREPPRSTSSSGS